MKSFASDNYAGVLPEVMDALAAANANHAPSYGSDTVTARTQDLIREQFGPAADILFVFNGTGANVLSISAATDTSRSVLCADTSHIYNDEGSAPETFTGCRFFPVPADEQGKLAPAAVAQRMIRKGDVHYAQPALLSVTQSTEYGTVYTPEELRALGAFCKEHGLYFHVDGSRFFNAAAGLGCSLRDISADAGVDILSLGGTKLGLMFGEAVIVFRPELAERIRFRQKQVMQLASKTRFIAAQFGALLRDELWLRAAGHANRMAQHLAQELQRFARIRITRPVQANVVFAVIPREWNEPMMAAFPFYVWQEAANEVRLMCAWDTTVEEIGQFIACIAALT